jgi:hypothetical protein
MARSPRPETFAGAPSSWAALSTDVEAAKADTGQMPLFDTPVAPAPARPARLRGRLQALLSRTNAMALVPREPGSSWPDSFFEVDDAP